MWAPRVLVDTQGCRQNAPERWPVLQVTCGKQDRAWGRGEAFPCFHSTSREASAAGSIPKAAPSGHGTEVSCTGQGRILDSPAKTLPATGPAGSGVGAFLLQ